MTLFLIVVDHLTRASGDERRGGIGIFVVDVDDVGVVSVCDKDEVDGEWAISRIDDG